MKKRIMLLLMVFSCGCVAAEVPSKHVKNMASEDFQTRQNAYDKLGLWAEGNPKTAPEAFYNLWEKQEDAEVKARCYGLMKDLFMALSEEGRPGFVGVSIGDTKLAGLNGAKARIGVLINSVNPGKAGDKAGLKVGDVVIKLDKLDFSELDERQAQPFGGGFATAAFITYIKSKQAGDEVVLIINREGKELEKKLILVSRPLELDIGARAAALHYDQAFKQWFDKLAE